MNTFSWRNSLAFSLDNRLVLNFPSMLQYRISFYTILFLLLAISTTSFSQFGGGGRGGGFGGFDRFSGGGSAGSSAQGEVVLDTSEIYYFYADNPNLIYPFRDSLLHNFQQFDPIRLRKQDWANLGNLGSATRPLIYQPSFRKGFDVGLDQFDMYQISATKLRFHKVEQAYTQAYFSQGQTQADADFNIRFSRNFANGVNLSLDHRRTNNSGAYDHQAVKNIVFGIGLWYHAPNERYDGFFAYSTNTIQQQDNGGITEPIDTFLPAFQVDINLLSAQTKHHHKEFSYTQYFKLNRTKAKKSTRPNPPPLQRDSSALIIQDSVIISTDSLQSSIQDSSIIAIKDTTDIKRPPANFPFNPGLQKSSNPAKSKAPLFDPTKRAFTLYHRFHYKSSSYKFYDEGQSGANYDTAYYADFYSDNRGLRHYLEVRQLENTFKIQTFKLKKDTTNLGLRQNDLIEVGLVHTLNIIQQDIIDTTNLNNLFLTGKIDFSPNERLKIETYAHLGLLKNAGDFRISGSLFLDFKKAGNFSASLVNQLYSPSLLQHRIFITSREFWKTDFDKTLETNISGTYSLPSFKLSVTGQYHLLTNYIYFDTLAVAQQTNTAISIFQLTVEKDFKFGPLHLDNAVTFQQITGNILRLPDFYSKHSLYLEGKIFKKVMLARIGLDARLSAGYMPDSYNPLIGQFHIQNQQDLSFLPLIDAFATIKVSTFRFFFKVDNLLSGIRKEYYYQTGDYALPYGFSSGGTRFGISWRFVD